MMYFTQFERAAIFCVAYQIIEADYDFSSGEYAWMQKFVDKFEVTRQLQAAAHEFNFYEACDIISSMPYPQSEFVAAFLTYLVVSDGEYCLAEVKELDRITMLCDLPSFTFPEAVDYLRNFDYDSILV